MPSRRVQRSYARLAIAAPLSGAAMLLGAVRPVPAQPRPLPRVTLDLGATSVAHTGTVGQPLAVQSSATVSPALRLTSDLAAVDAGGTWTQPMAARSGWSAQGALAGTLFSPALGPLRAEFSAAASGSAHRDLTRTGRLLGGGRLHAIGDRTGVWAGGSTGRVWDGVAWRATRAADAGAWLAHRGMTAIVSAAPTSVAAGAAPTRYTDVESGARWAAPRLELAGAVGTRLGRSPALLAAGDRAAWGSASVTAWVLSDVAVVAAAGSYPVDFAQSFPGGRFATVGVRLAAARPPARRAGADGAVRPGATQRLAGGAAESPIAVDGAPVVAVAPAEARSAGARTLRVRAASATTVAVTGDPTGWEPVPLARAADGWWTVTLPLRPGAHQIAVRVDGGAWRVPAGLATVRDEFGGEAGLLVVSP